MVVVADTSPLNYLVLINAIDILPQLYRHVIIPPAVYAELRAAETPEQVQAWITQAPPWLEVKPLTQLPDVALAYLGLGEREAITLAQELQAAALIIDDRDGRREADERGLNVIGTIGVLAAAAEHGLLDLAQVLERLQATNFRIAPRFIQILLNRSQDSGSSRTES